MRDINFLRTPIRGDQQFQLLNLSISETPLLGNPLPTDLVPQTVQISFELPPLAEVEIAPLWGGSFRFIPDSTAGNPTDPAQVAPANLVNWSLTGDLILHSDPGFTDPVSFQDGMEAGLPNIRPIPTFVRYSKVRLTSSFIFTTLFEANVPSIVYDGRLVYSDESEFFEKLVISFLAGTAYMPCELDENDPNLDTALKPMPVVEMAPAGAPTVLKITCASLSEKIDDLAWWENEPVFDGFSGETLVDPALHTEADLKDNPAHPSHSVISTWAVFRDAVLIAYAPDQGPAIALRAALEAALPGGLAYRRIELIRPPVPGAPVGSAPQRPFPMYKLCWHSTQGGPTETQRLPLSGSLYLQLPDGLFTFWAIPRSQDAGVFTTGDQLKVSTGALPPSKHVFGPPQGSVDIALAGQESVTVYAHLQEFDGAYVWKQLSGIAAERDRLIAKAAADWNAPVNWWYFTDPTVPSRPYGEVYGFVRESAGRHGLAPEFLLTVMMGEGASRYMEIHGAYDPNARISGFGVLGLDLILYRVGGLDGDGNPPAIPGAISAEERAEYEYNLVTEGYVDQAVADSVEWTQEVPNEKGLLIQIADVTGWANAVELVAAELHARLDEMLAYLASKSPPDPVPVEVQQRFLIYARYNASIATCQDLADDLANKVKKWVGDPPPDNKNAHYNALRRVATAQWQEESGVLR